MWNQRRVEHRRDPELARRHAEHSQFMRQQGSRVFGTIMYAMDMLQLYAWERIMEKGRFGRLQYWAEDEVRAQIAYLENMLRLRVNATKMIPRMFDHVEGVPEQIALEDAVAHRIVKKLFKRMHILSKNANLYRINILSPVGPADEIDPVTFRPVNRPREDEGSN